VLSKVKRGDIQLTKAAELMGVSYRQVLRIWVRYESAGSAGLKHGLRDRLSNRRLEAGRKERVLELYQAKYGDFGPTLAVEYLRKDDGEDLSEETLRRWLIAAGLWQARRQGARHRKWRERRAHWGEMVQMDGSEHDWFEGRRERASLMVLIDDATNWTHAKFFESETTAAGDERVCGVRGPLWLAASVVRGSGQYLRNDAGFYSGRGLEGRRTADAVWPGDAGIGGRVDPGAEPASQGSGGASAWSVSGSFREGLAAEEDRYFGSGERIFGEQVSGRVE
jgi:transposase